MNEREKIEMKKKIKSWVLYTAMIWVPALLLIIIEVLGLKR